MGQQPQERTVATNSQVKTIHRVLAGQPATVCLRSGFRPANAMQLMAGKRCATCWPGATPAPAVKGPASSAKPDRKTAAPAPQPVAPAADTTADREISSWTYRIDAFQLAATESKIDKINARAAKRGLGGRITLESKTVEVTSTDEFTGFSTTRTMYDVTLGGTAPAYNGWSFIGTLDWDPSAGLIVSGVPGAHQIDRAPLREGWCDHCRTTRTRRVTYVVRDDSNGQQLQVGRSCIKDFIGWSGTVSFPDLPGQDDEEGGGWFGPRGEAEFTPATVVAYAWATIKIHGFVRTSEYWSEPTRNRVDEALYPNVRNAKSREYAEAMRPLAEEAAGRAQEILAFIKSDDFAGSSDYVTNLKALAAGAMCSRRYFGLMVSAPQAHARHLEQTLIRERQARDGADSQWLGTAPDKANGIKGERLTLEVTVAGITYLQGNFGTTTIYTLVDADRNRLKWFASADALGETEGARFVIKGTVKAHDEYKGTKSTVLTRCAVVEELDPAAA
jgi:hypothetical protein